MEAMEANFTPTLGAYEIGVLVSVYLFGLVTVQTFEYFGKFPHDSWYMKSFVGALWFLELAHTIFSSHSLYWVSVIKYGKQEFVNEFPTSLIITIVLSGITGPAIQAFFANRIRVLTHKRVLCWCLCLLCLMRSISLVAVAVVAHKSRTIAQFRENWLWLLVASLAISTALDVLITASLCCHLFYRRRTTLRRMRRVLDRLIVWTIQTGMLTMLATITMLIMFILMDNFAWVALFFVTSRLFLNALMTSLNDRTTLRALDDKLNTVSGLTDLHSTHPTNIHFRYHGRGTTDINWADGEGEVQKGTKKESEEDSERI